MGEARRRGSYEERVEQSVQRSHEELEQSIRQSIQDKPVVRSSRRVNKHTALIASLLASGIPYG